MKSYENDPDGVWICFEKGKGIFFALKILLSFIDNIQK